MFKMNLRKNICYIVVVYSLFILLTGCAEKTNGVKITDEPKRPNTIIDNGSNETESPSGTVKPDITIDIPDFPIKLYQSRMGINNWDESQIKEWQEYMYDKYSYTIDLKISEENYFLTVDIEEIKEKTGLDSLVYCDSLILLNSLIDNGLVKPINDIIFNIDEYNTIDDHLMISYTDLDNNIWAFPFGLMNRTLPPSTRFYNKEWLEKSGMSVPKTLDEFYAYAEFISEGDPDGNGKRDTYITSVNTKHIHDLFSDLSDIWVAYGCYFDMGPISYNPKTGQFENFILSEGFAEAALYIRNMIDREFINLYDDNEEGEEISLSSASAGSTQISNTQKYKDYEIGYYLIGPNDRKLIKMVPPTTCLAVLEDTENVKEQVESLLALLSVSEEGYMDFKAGIKDKHYSENNGRYEYLYVDDKINLLWMDFKFKYFPSEGMFTYMEGNDINTLYTTMRNNARQELEELSNLDIAYSIPISTYTYALQNANNLQGKGEWELLYAIFIANVDIQEALENYRLECEKRGIERLIQSLNSGL